MSQKMLCTNENFKKQEKQRWKISLIPLLFAMFLLFFREKLQAIVFHKHNKHIKHKDTKRNNGNSVIQN